MTCRGRSYLCSCTVSLLWPQLAATPALQMSSSARGENEFDFKLCLSPHIILKKCPHKRYLVHELWLSLFLWPSFPFWHCFYKSSLHPRCCKQTSSERGESLPFERMQWMTHKRPSAHHFLPHAFFAFSVAPRAHEVRWGIHFIIPVLYRSTPKRTKTELCVC